MNCPSSSWFRHLLLVLLGAVLLAGSGEAEAASYKPAGDAYVHSGQATTNFGSSTELHVGDDPDGGSCRDSAESCGRDKDCGVCLNNNRPCVEDVDCYDHYVGVCDYSGPCDDSTYTKNRSYLKFEVETLDDKLVVSEAVLHLYAAARGDDSVPIEVKKTTASWAESSITWNSQASYTLTTIGDSSRDQTVDETGTEDVRSWYEIKVTKEVQDRTGDSLGFVVVHKAEDGANPPPGHWVSFSSSESGFDPYLEITQVEPEDDEEFSALGLWGVVALMAGVLVAGVSLLLRRF
ncbi:MAG: DNRLRE domain-containing protein [bacterium]|nr:DNRLRE domain-containing protein [bacterium]